MTSQNRFDWFAIATGLALAFASGLIFDSLAGWAVSYDTPTVFERCSNHVDRPNCVAMANAEATATIARWTRWDTLLSLFTGLAAIFAFFAYREAKRQANATEKTIREVERQAEAAESALALADDRQRADRHEKAAAERGIIFIDWMDLALQYVLDDDVLDPKLLKVTGRVRNVGLSLAQEISANISVEFWDIGDKVWRLYNGSLKIPGMVRSGDDHKISLFLQCVTKNQGEGQPHGPEIARGTMTLNWTDLYGYQIQQSYSLTRGRSVERSDLVRKFTQVSTVRQSWGLGTAPLTLLHMPLSG